MRSTLLLTLACAIVPFVVASKCGVNLKACTVGQSCCGSSQGYVCSALKNGETGSFCVPPALPFGNFNGTALNFIAATTTTKATAAIIFLHGLAQSGAQMKQYMLSLIGNGKGAIVGSEHIKWVFPSGPLWTIERSVLQNFVAIQGATRGWYDAELGTLSEQSFGLFVKSQATDLAKSSRYINNLITRLGADGIPPSRIVLAGFSQGGTVALNVALTIQQQLAGVVSIAGAVLPPPNRNTFTSLPVWLAAGTTDTLIPFYYMQNVARFLNSSTPLSDPYKYPFPTILNFGMTDVTFKAYVTDAPLLRNHIITKEEAAAALAFMLAKVPK